MIEPAAHDPVLLLQIAEQYGHKKSLSLGEILTPTDPECDPIAFLVISGVCRVVHPIEDGTEITKTFLRSGRFGVTPFRATASSAISYVESVTKCDLRIMQWSRIEDQIKSSPGVRQAVEAELANHTAWKTERWIDDRTLSSTERYLKSQEFLKEDFDKIPLHLIANYIGISPVQLSRLRRRLKDGS